MIVIKDTGSVPDGGWRYPGVTAGFFVKAPFAFLYAEIVKHYQNNGAQPPSQEEVTQYLCRELAIDCYEAETHTPIVNRFSLGLPSPSVQSGCCK